MKPKYNKNWSQKQFGVQDILEYFIILNFDSSRVIGCLLSCEWDQWVSIFSSEWMEHYSQVLFVPRIFQNERALVGLVC